MRAPSTNDAATELREAVHAALVGDDVMLRLRPAIEPNDERRRWCAASEPVDEGALALVTEAEPEDHLDRHVGLPHALQNLASARRPAPHDGQVFVTTTGAPCEGAAREPATCAIAPIALS